MTKHQSGSQPKRRAAPNANSESGSQKNTKEITDNRLAQTPVARKVCEGEGRTCRADRCANPLGDIPHDRRFCDTCVAAWRAELVGARATRSAR